MSEYWQHRRETRAEAMERIHAEFGWPECMSVQGFGNPEVKMDRAAFEQRFRERFMPDQSREAVAERLGIEIGDPDAESGDWGERGAA